jgi:hypothetical protein
MLRVARDIGHERSIVGSANDHDRIRIARRLADDDVRIEIVSDIRGSALVGGNDRVCTASKRPRCGQVRWLV